MNLFFLRNLEMKFLENIQMEERRKINQIIKKNQKFHSRIQRKYELFLNNRLTSLIT